MPNVDLIWQELNEAINQQFSTGGVCRLLDQNEAARIVTSAQATFVIGSPRTWWLSLRERPAIFPYPNCDAPDHIANHAPSEGCSRNATGTFPPQLLKNSDSLAFYPTRFLFHFVPFCSIHSRDFKRFSQGRRSKSNDLFHIHCRAIFPR